jgi:hypothetical protein
MNKNQFKESLGLSKTAARRLCDKGMQNRGYFFLDDALYLIAKKSGRTAPLNINRYVEPDKMPLIGRDVTAESLPAAINEIINLRLTAKLLLSPFLEVKQLENLDQILDAAKAAMTERCNPKTATSRDGAGEVSPEFDKIIETVVLQVGRDTAAAMKHIYTAEIIPLKIFSPDGIKLYYFLEQYNSLHPAFLKLTAENIRKLDFPPVKFNGLVFIPMQHKIDIADHSEAASHAINIEHAIFLELATRYAFFTWNHDEPENNKIGAE